MRGGHRIEDWSGITLYAKLFKVSVGSDLVPDNIPRKTYKPFSTLICVS